MLLATLSSCFSHVSILLLSINEYTGFTILLAFMFTNFLKFLPNNWILSCFRNKNILSKYPYMVDKEAIGEQTHKMAKCLACQHSFLSKANPV